ncbi:MAG: hypothetical protein ACO3TR_07045, partial [Burkholderiaceae bacterium]
MTTTQPVQRLLLKGGHVLDAASGLDGIADLYLANGSIVAIRPTGQGFEGFQADEVLALNG